MHGWYSFDYVNLFCGFSDQSHYTRHFKKSLGCTPAQYLAHKI